MISIKSKDINYICNYYKMTIRNRLGFSLNENWLVQLYYYGISNEPSLPTGSLLDKLYYRLHSAYVLVNR